MNLSDIRREMSADSRRGAPGLPAFFWGLLVLCLKGMLSAESVLLFSKCRVVVGDQLHAEVFIYRRA